jgi:hypothetical protein
VGQAPLSHCDSAATALPQGLPSFDAGEERLDVQIALDFAMMAVRGECDVGVLMSGDTDLLPALEEIARLNDPVPRLLRGSQRPAVDTDFVLETHPSVATVDHDTYTTIQRQHRLHNTLADRWPPPRAPSNSAGDGVEVTLMGEGLVAGFVFDQRRCSIGVSTCGVHFAIMATASGSVVSHRPCRGRHRHGSGDGG